MDYVPQIMKVLGLVHSYARMHLYLHTYMCLHIFWMRVSVPLAFTYCLLPNICIVHTVLRIVVGMLASEC